jgi:hypothetical protein
MPLVTLEILESKIKELLLILNHLKEENDLLKKQIKNSNKEETALETNYEIEKLKDQILKYKNNKIILNAKIKMILNELEQILRKE